MKCIKTWAQDCWRLLFPRVCIGCGNYLVEGETHVCLNCLVDLPRTDYHLKKDNPIEQLFWGRVPIEQATSWCFYSKGGKVQNLLHALKYKDYPSVGVFMGTQMAYELGTWLQGVDALVPVPLHPKKQKIRGYNQSEKIAQGIAQVTQLPMYPNGLLRIASNLTQTHKGVYERWQNAQGLFVLNKKDFSAHFWQDKHVLLIDDVITTGATIEACAECLVRSGARVSILSVAVSLPDNF